MQFYCTFACGRANNAAPGPPSWILGSGGEGENAGENGKGGRKVGGERRKMEGGEGMRTKGRKGGKRKRKEREEKGKGREEFCAVVTFP